MITRKSAKREIKDLQRLLLAVCLMRSKKIAKWKAGVWGDESQRAVLAAYTQPGWDHPVDARWISAPALAAVAAVLHVDGVAAQVTSGGFGGGANMGSGSSIRLCHDRGLRHADRMVCTRIATRADHR